MTKYFHFRKRPTGSTPMHCCMFWHYNFKSLIVLLTTCSIMLVGLLFTIVGLNMHDPYYKIAGVNFGYQEILDGHSRESIAAEIILNMNGPSYKIWQDESLHSSCTSYETRFGIGIKRVWLMSYPCSGNTWARYLIEAATGIFTGSVYRDKILYKEGFLGEYEDVMNGTTLTQKSHGLTIYNVKALAKNSLQRSNVLDPTIPTILLLRDPKSALISYWKYKNNNRKENAHTAHLPSIRFQTSEFHKFVKTSVHLWEQLAVDVILETKAPLHILHYEYLKQNTTQYLGLLLDFLGIPVNEQRMNCISSHLDGSFKRKNTGNGFDPFTQEEKDQFAVAVDKVHRLIKAKGYPDPPMYGDWLS